MAGALKPTNNKPRTSLSRRQCPAPHPFALFPAEGWNSNEGNLAFYRPMGTKSKTSPAPPSSTVAFMPLRSVTR